MSFKKEILDELLQSYKTPEDMFGANGVFAQLKKALVERALEAEMKHHLGYEKNEVSQACGNYRNGKTTKKVITDTGSVNIDIPRDKNAEFEPQLIGKYQRRLPGFDDKIISMYARGMTTRDIQDHIQELYQTEVSPSLISVITDEVLDEVSAWQSRPLDQVYPIVYLDAIVLKIKDNGQVQNKALYLAIGVNCDGNKEILGMWLSINEGAKFWLSVITKLKNRGVQDILIACVDGLKGFPEAINAIFPKTQIQLCIVHMVRNSLKYVSYKNRKEIAQDLKNIYTALNDQEAQKALAVFKEKWDKTHPAISGLWERNWHGIIPFLSYPDYIRKVIYTTNAIESINFGILKITRHRRIFPDDKAAFKLVYLALQNMIKKWTMPIFNWKDALNQFAIIFEDRISLTNR